MHIRCANETRIEENKLNITNSFQERCRILTPCWNDDDDEKEKGKIENIMCLKH